MVNLNTLRRNLHIALYDHKMSRPELAKKVGASSQMINYIINGEKIPSVTLLAKIANALDTTIDELLK